MLKVTLSHYTLDGVRVHQVMANGMPVIRETTDEAVARSAFEKVVSGEGQFRGCGAKVQLAEWDGDSGVLVDLGEVRTAA